MGDQWVELAGGQSVGRKKIDYFEEAEVSAIELDVTGHVGTPLIRSLSVYYVEGFTPYEKESLNIWGRTAGIMELNEEMFTAGKAHIELDLSERIHLPGQYIIKVVPDDNDAQVRLTGARVFYDGSEALQEFVTVSGQSIRVNRTAVVSDRGSSVLTFIIECEIPCSGKITFNAALVY